MTNPLYLIDSNIYIYHAWHSLPTSLRNKDNHAANAVYGFGEFLLRLLNTENPQFIACVFDTNRTQCARRKIFPDYKVNRSDPADELLKQFPWCEEAAKALGIKCYSSRSVEADDIIGTLAQEAQKQGIEIVILSADKDLTQFIRQGDFMWDYQKNRRYSLSDIKKKYQLNPNQIPDMLALAGDKVDNIPGVPGIGSSTAARLLIKWGNLDNLYANLDCAANMKFRGARNAVKLVAEFKKDVYLSRRLTGLIKDRTISFDIDSLVPCLNNVKRQETLFEKLAFSEQRRTRWLKTISSYSLKVEQYKEL